MTRFAVVDLRTEKQVADYATRQEAQARSDLERAKHKKPFQVFWYNQE